MKEDISKILYKKLSSLPDSKVLLWPDFQASFNATTGQSINDHLEDTQEVLDELEASKYIRCEQLPNKMPKLIKGVNFDAWGQVMSPTQNNNPINIGAVNASNVQVGNQNSMVVNVTPDELVEALTKLTEKSSKESQQSIIDKLHNYVKSGVNLGEAVAKLVALIG